MENKTVKGIVADVNQNWKSVKIGNDNYSGKFTYKGELPSKGDEVEMEVGSSISKKDGKTYWNILTIKVIKANTTPNVDSKVEFRMNVDAGNCLERAVQLIIADKFKDLKVAMLEVTAAFRLGLEELARKPEPIRPADEIDY